MTDPHIRILQQMADQSQRALRSYDAVDHNRCDMSINRRKHLARTATRTRARVASAHARRRQPRSTRIS
jgi:hypothetical protein